MVAKATSIVATGVDCARDIVKDLSQRQFFYRSAYDSDYDDL